MKLGRKSAFAFAFENLKILADINHAYHGISLIQRYHYFYDRFTFWTNQPTRDTISFDLNHLQPLEQFAIGFTKECGDVIKICEKKELSYLRNCRTQIFTKFVYKVNRLKGLNNHCLYKTYQLKELNTVDANDLKIYWLNDRYTYVLHSVSIIADVVE